MEKIALLSTPWPLYSRPSIQLGTLKAYLRSLYPDVRIDAHHVYLTVAQAIGYELYHQISERTWLAEAIYAALLYPERFGRIEKHCRREAGGAALLGKTGLKDLSSRVKKATDAVISDLNWGNYLLAGFSVSLCQLTSSLYFITRLKKKFPHLTVAVGGSTFSGVAMDYFFELFPAIDVVVNGEGELPLGRLIGFLRETPNLADIPPISGIISAQATPKRGRRTEFHQMPALTKLPTPDYDDYFDLLKSFAADKWFFPILPVETSRGCWWQPTAKTGKITGCAFCNLNLQWKGYRAKNPSQVVAEIDDLTARHQSLSVAIVDNVLPKKTSTELFGKLSDLDKDLRLFAEIRATTSWQELRAMRNAGMREVQIGIEALCTPLLQKLHKGTTAIQNLEIMKNCEALGIANISNLILHFPGSDENDVMQTMHNLEFALIYRPLKPVEFWLGLGSPVWQNPGDFGIKAVFNHPNWAHLFPPKIFNSFQFMVQDYRGDRGFQRRLWRPVKIELRVWQKSYQRLHQGSNPDPILSYRDGRDFLIIRQRSVAGGPQTHRLVGNSRNIYLFCRRHRPLKRIREQFLSLPEDKIVDFLKMMVAKKLMFAENDHYLSLAVPINPERPTKTQF